jgi:hypothetical protein
MAFLAVLAVLAAVRAGCIFVVQGVDHIEIRKTGVALRYAEGQESRCYCGPGPGHLAHLASIWPAGWACGGS